jgi:hypothetical protein
VETLVLYKAAEKSLLDRFEPTGIFFLTVVGIVLSSQQVGKKAKESTSECRHCRMEARKCTEYFVNLRKGDRATLRCIERAGWK